MSMDSLRSILPKVLKKRGLDKHAQASRVTYLAQLWLEKALPRMKEAIDVKSFTRGVVIIRCKHGIAAQECHHQVSSLLDHLRHECPGLAIDDVQLTRADR